MTTRPFRFGVVAGHASDLDSFTATARRAERLGYDTLVTPDPVGEYDPLALLPFAAAVTSTLHVGTFVLVDAFRDPRMLGWQARTLDALTGGRLELGLGPGRPEAEQRARVLGGEYGRPGSRIDRLARTIDHLDGQQDRPPLLLSAGGPRMRALAAARADIVTMAWQPATTESEAKSIVDDFRAAAAARLPEIELAANLLAIGDEPAPWLERFVGTSVERLAADGAVTVVPGGTRQVADTLRRWRSELGISYFTINSGFLEPFGRVIEELRGS